MSLSLNQYINQVKQKPGEAFIGLCAISVAVMGTSVNHVASASFLFLTIAGLSIFLSWKETWQKLENSEKVFLIGFALYALSGLVSYINVQDVDEYIKDLERYIRFLFAIPLYLYLRKYSASIVKYLYAGAILSGPFLFYIAMSSYLENSMLPARGYYHHIIFGSVAMLNVGVMLSLLLVGKTSRFLKAILIISMLLAFVAAILSQSRGVWLVLPVYLLITLYVTWRQSVKRFSVMMAAVLIGLILVALSPVSNMIENRIDIAVDEVTAYYQDNKYASSVGARLAMWNIAFDLWKQHPVVGIGPGDFDNVIRDMQSEGEYVGMEVHASTHNIFVQALVGTGIIGLLITVLGLFVFPLYCIMQATGRTSRLTGLLMLCAFLVIGISESWTLRLSIISVYIIYSMILIASIFSKTETAS